MADVSAHVTSLATFVGDDGAKVVQIDTAPNGGRLRVNLNDAPIWDGNPDVDDPPAARLRQRLAELNHTWLERRDGALQGGRHSAALAMEQCAAELRAAMRDDPGGFHCRNCGLEVFADGTDDEDTVIWTHTASLDHFCTRVGGYVAQPANADGSKTMNIPSTITVPDPDDPLGQPIFEGAPADAHSQLVPGVYDGIDADREPVKLRVTTSSATAERA